MELIKFKTDETGITIHIPTELLRHVATNNPEPIKINDGKRFVEQVAFELENNLCPNESGLTGFQELLDSACIAVAEDGDCADFVE